MLNNPRNPWKCFFFYIKVTFSFKFLYDTFIAKNIYGIDFYWNFIQNICRHLPRSTQTKHEPLFDGKNLHNIYFIQFIDIQIILVTLLLLCLVIGDSPVNADCCNLWVLNRGLGNFWQNISTKKVAKLDSTGVAWKLINLYLFIYR